MNQSDVESIEAVAMDYAEGWYTADTGRMERCLHPALIKRTVVPGPGGDGWSLNEPTSAEGLIGYTRDGGGSGWPGEIYFKVDVLDIFRDVATVRCASPEYIDYLHVARFGDAGWRIVNVLWQLQHGDFDPSS